MRRLGILLLAVAAAVAAFGKGDAYQAYIEQYAAMAMEQQERHGIPASITLAQGLLESAAGRSTLAREGNNHFGIKCGGVWQGASMLRDDDAPDECFRVYDNAAQSYEDHSDFLRKRRYARLFDLDISDYRGWARGLSECGYATDPQYASRLVAIIERYGLYSYDAGSQTMAEEAAQFIMSHLQAQHPVTRYRDLYFVIALPGDTYESLARDFNIPVERLTAYNDATDPRAPIKEWEEVYLQEKHKEGPKNVKKATIGEGESMHSLSQRFGMKLSSLQALNPGVPDKPGRTLKLR